MVRGYFAWRFLSQTRKYLSCVNRLAGYMKQRGDVNFRCLHGKAIVPTFALFFSFSPLIHRAQLFTCLHHSILILFFHSATLTLAFSLSPSLSHSLSRPFHMLFLLCIFSLSHLLFRLRFFTVTGTLLPVKLHLSTLHPPPSGFCR